MLGISKVIFAEEILMLNYLQTLPLDKYNIVQPSQILEKLTYINSAMSNVLASLSHWKKNYLVYT